jgi:hypothetical protein
VSWKAESIYVHCQYPCSRVIARITHLGKVNEGWPFCHVFSFRAWTYPSRGIVVEVTEELLLLLWRG